MQVSLAQTRFAIAGQLGWRKYDRSLDAHGEGSEWPEETLTYARSFEKLVRQRMMKTKG